MQSFDLAIIGAGPAGLSAAIAAARHNLTTVVLDEQAAPGGQIYRNIEALQGSVQAAHILGSGYMAGLQLVTRFRASGASYIPSAQVWQIEPGTVWFRDRTGACALKAKQILIATGAMERPMPVPGWTLPGVMTCGAGQILLKSGGLAWSGKLVIAGNGPLLFLLATQLLRAGIKPEALIETGANYWKSLRHLLSFLMVPEYFATGAGLLSSLYKSKVQIQRRAADLRILGKGRASAVQYRHRDETKTVAADLVLLHQGVVPNVQLAMATRCQHQWNDAQRSFLPQVSDWGESSIRGILIAGDSSGIAGAKAAELSGQLAALSAAVSTGHLTLAERNDLGRHPLSVLRRHQSARLFLDALYQPHPSFLAPKDDQTIVCRCEEVTAGQICRLVREQYCPGPNQMKAFVRSGMGPCQGRLCGLTVVEIIARERGISPDAVGYYRIRPPIKPVSLGDLANDRIVEV